MILLVSNPFGQRKEPLSKRANDSHFESVHSLSDSLFYLETQTTSMLYSDTQTTINLTHTQRLLPFSHSNTDYFHSHTVTQTTPILTQLHRLLPSYTVTQTTLILTHTLRLLHSLSDSLLLRNTNYFHALLRHTDYYKSHSYTKTTPILTQ